MTVEVMIGRGRDAIDMVVDPGSFRENQVGDVTFPDDVGPGAVVGEDADKPVGEKRPLVLIVDTPGNGPGKIEEIFGMNKATGSYQLALAEARKSGHSVIALVIGRAISGAFLCHGLQADHILSLSPEFGTMIHVMPITSISRITKMDIERLEELSKENPVFAEVEAAKLAGDGDATGPMGHGTLGEERGGRMMRRKVIDRMEEEFSAVAGKYL